MVRRRQLPGNTASSYRCPGRQRNSICYRNPESTTDGTVVGLGWAIAPDNGNVGNGLPSVNRSLDWIQLAARFPVRIKVENPDDSFRIGASAVATVRGNWRAGGQ